MNKLDSLFDTFEKRVHWILLFYLLATLILSVMYLYLGIAFVQVQNYQDLMLLLEMRGLENIMIGRLALVLLSMPVLDTTHLMFSVCQLSTVEVIFVLHTFLFVINKGNSKAERKGKTLAKIQIGGYFLLTFSIVLGFSLGFQAGNVQEITLLLRSIGIVWIVICSLMFIYQFMKLVGVMVVDLPHALETTVEIIE